MVLSPPTGRSPHTQQKGFWWHYRHGNFLDFTASLLYARNYQIRGRGFDRLSRISVASLVDWSSLREDSGRRGTASNLTAKTGWVGDNRLKFEMLDRKFRSVAR